MRSRTGSDAGACSSSGSASSRRRRSPARSHRASPCSRYRGPRRESARRSCSPYRSHSSPTPSRASAERAGALAAYGATIGGSFAFGPLIGGALTSGFGWRAIFVINVPLGLIAIAATYWRVEESRDEHPRPIDWTGQLLLGGGLFLLVLGLLRGNGDGWGSTAIVAELSGAVVLLAAFLAVEHRSPRAMLPLKVFRNRSFTAAQVGAFAISGSLFALFLYMTLYLQNVLHLSPVEAGLVYMPGTLVNFVVAGASAQLGDRVSPRVMVSGGLALVAAGMLMLTIAAVDSSWTVFLPGSIVAMIGTGMFNPAISGLALGSLPERDSGLAAGTNDTFRQAGIAVGIAALGALIPASAALGHGDPASYVSGMREALVAGAALAAAGALVTMRLLRTRGAARTDGELALDCA